MPSTLGLPMHMRFVARTCRAEVDVRSLRRPELVVRSTRYANIVVDERILTRAFPIIAPPSRLLLVVLLEGRLSVGAPESAFDVSPGEAILVVPEMTRAMRWVDARFVDVEWTAPDAASLTEPRRLGRPDEALVQRILRGLEEDGEDHRARFAEGIELVRSLGVAIPIESAALSGAPSERDVRLARAIGEQLANLADAASTLHFGEIAELSPRQLQRVVGEFAARYGMNAGNWRDMRNRWRVQLAAVLLSLPETNVGVAAKEVGYASTAAVARAFANAGFRPPTEVRQALLAARERTAGGRE